MTQVTFVANQGEIGGGEVMLLSMADAARRAGWTAVAAGPAGEVLDAAAAGGFPTVEIRAGSTVGYLRGLRAWARSASPGLLWCNGLRPAVATAGLPRRVVHLHSMPRGLLRSLVPLATRGAAEVVVPSEWMRERLVLDVRTLPNWTRDLSYSPRLPPTDEMPVRLGFLGRLTSAKGAVVLAEALQRLRHDGSRRYQLVIGGASRFTVRRDNSAVRAALSEVIPAPVDLGWVEPGDFFAQVDLAVFPSVAPESFGLVAAEAMAAGCPFVVTDAGALPEVTAHDPRFVARAGHADDLARAIAAATAHYSPDHLHSSRARWEAQYSPEVGAERFARFLHEGRWT